ncbi:DUF4255 domain-containing protein [Kitasatospora aureofaciens]|uniref:DUF4255 domain-containing protein n=1 Tax=Kitasatospora aureofaciens TaxID=1894 RepID=UPI001C450107|nr:DUF4255 domain-containing protein [Kitasatospora aureofaciens]MBV6696787.1 DUF4255 domain-containing protein [Kitasatospora aureofaciens]
MSDEEAIAAVTKTLSGLILHALADVPGAGVDTRPLDELADGTRDKLVNVYLFQADVDGSLRNADRLDLAPGESGGPPFPLVLHYLVTPFVKRDPGLDAHRLLARAVRVLHDNPVLQRSELAAFAPESDVAKQLDRIRITWQPFGEKDIYSLWTAFQTPYRMSVAYEVSAVLIDGHRPPAAPVPVLSRGPDDRGPTAQAGLPLGLPALAGAVPPDGQPAVRPGDRVVLRGGGLTARSAEARLNHPMLPAPVVVPLAPGSLTDGEARFTVPAGTPAGLWSAGLALTRQVTEGGVSRQVVTVTNEVPLAVAPRITHLPAQVPRTTDGSAVIELRYSPAALPGQPVLLIFDGRAIPPDLPGHGAPRPPDHPRFTVPHAATGRHLVRLRVAGVDSLLVDRSGPRPVFDPTQAVTVT